MADEEGNGKKGGGKGLIIVLVIMMFLMMIGMGVLAFLLLSKDDGGDKKDVDDAQATQQHAPVEHGGGTDDGVVREYSPQFKQFAPPEPGSPPQYFEMKPFVVNFKGDGQAKFLAVTLKIMTYYPQLVTEMESLRPILRNDITTILRIQHYNELSKDDGPDVLRKRLLDKAREVVSKHSIYPDLLEDVFFDRFVMQ